MPYRDQYIDYAIRHNNYIFLQDLLDEDSNKSEPLSKAQRARMEAVLDEQDIQYTVPQISEEQIERATLRQALHEMRCYLTQGETYMSKAEALAFVNHILYPNDSQETETEEKADE